MDTLFDGKFEYDSLPELNAFLEQQTVAEAVGVVEMALNLCLTRGCFTLTEAAVLFYCLQSLRTHESRLPLIR